MNLRQTGALIVLTVTTALLIGALTIHTLGITPILMFAACWWAQPLPTWDEEFDTFLRQLR